MRKKRPPTTTALFDAIRFFHFSLNRRLISYPMTTERKTGRERFHEAGQLEGGSFGRLDSAELPWRHGMPGRVVIVAMMTPRPTTLHRAAVVHLPNILTAFHLMADRIAERPWTPLPVASHLAILAPALDAFHLPVRVDTWVPFHPVLVRSAKRVLASTGSEDLLGGASSGGYSLVAG